MRESDDARRALVIRSGSTVIQLELKAVECRVVTDLVGHSATALSNKGRRGSAATGRDQRLGLNERRAGRVCAPARIGCLAREGYRASSDRRSRANPV